jgi:serine protease Do
VMKVEWQLFDPLEKKLLFRGMSEGIVDVSRIVARDEGITAHYVQMLPEAARNAFQQAAKAIVADPNFVAAARDPKGGAPAQSPTNELFPEAQNAAPPAPPPLQIIRLPLSTKPFKDQVVQLRDQVVTVLTPGGQGSGFYVADGMLLTNHHVIAGYSRVRLRFYGGREIEGEVVSSNAKRDIALIKTAGAGVAGLPLRLEPPQLAATVFVIGTPARDRNEGSVISGIISAFRDEKDGPFIQSDVAVTHGNSGGPMFDDTGNVIGLVDKGDRDAAAVNRFIPIADALKVLDIKFAP